MLTPTQKSALKAVALADQVASAYITSGNDTGLAEWFNTPTVHVAWRSAMTPDQSRAAIIQGAAQLDALTVGKRDSLFWLASGDLKVADPTVRAAIDDLCGTQSALKAALLAAEKRTCSIAEKTLSTGTGTNAVPATLGWEGTLSGNDISEIREAA